MRRRILEGAMIALALVGSNLHLGGSDVDPAHLLPAAIDAGEWWRWLTHPFVHASGYHLALDGIAFGVALALLGGRFATRWGAVAVTAAGAALAVLLLDPRVHEIGYGGLSGVAHGLFVVWGVRAAAIGEDRVERCVAAAMALGVIAKTVIEGAIGGVVFADSHWGYVGTPLETSHVGGVAAGLIFAAVEAGCRRLGARPVSRIEGQRERGDLEADATSLATEPDRSLVVSEAAPGR